MFSSASNCTYFHISWLQNKYFFVHVIIHWVKCSSIQLDDFPSDFDLFSIWTQKKHIKHKLGLRFNVFYSSPFVWSLEFVEIKLKTISEMAKFSMGEISSVLLKINQFESLTYDSCWTLHFSWLLRVLTCTFISLL